MRDVPIPEVQEEEVSTPKSNAQFKTLKQPSFAPTDNNGWNKNQESSQFHFGGADQKLQINETLQFNQNFG